MIEPDTLVASQFPNRLLQQAARAPERRLAIAILQDAVECYQKCSSCHDQTTQQLFVEAEHWIMSRNHEYVFSFECICELLEINPDFLRRGLLACRAQQ